MYNFYYPFAFEPENIWEVVSDFWQDFENRDELETFWKAYKIIFDDHISRFSFAISFAQSLEYFDVSPEFEWYMFEKGVSGIMPTADYYAEIDMRIYDMPFLQNKKENPDDIFVQGTDFSLYETGGKKYIKRLGGSNLLDYDYLWAPKIEFDFREFLYKFIGCLIPNLDYKDYIPDQYKLVLQSIFWYSFKGPSLDNLKKVVAAMAEVIQIPYDGVITRVRSTGNTEEITMVANYDNIKRLYVVPTGENAVEKGDTVSRFEPVQIGIIVKDFHSHPNWWSSYSDINDIQARNIVYVEIESNIVPLPQVSWFDIYVMLKFLLPKRVKIKMITATPAVVLPSWDIVPTNKTPNRLYNPPQAQGL